VASNRKEFRNNQQTLKINKTDLGIRSIENNKPQNKDKAQETPCTFKSPEGKIYALMVEGVPTSEIERRREAIECLR
jgi:hypothetical protein